MLVLSARFAGSASSGMLSGRLFQSMLFTTPIVASM